MARVAAALPWPKQVVFHVSYAAMRVIDDFVDDDFLAQAPDERARLLPSALARLEQWRVDATAAATGRYSPSPGAPDAGEAILFNALQAVCEPAGAIGPAPFHALAGALEADLRERPLPRWSDFHAYAEGAAVAPASIFVTLLATDIDRDFAGRYSPATPATDYARALAIFCYLVHILRDLAEDARGHPQLLTVPAEVLAPLGLDRDSFGAAIRAGDARRVEPAIGAIAGEARRWRPRALADVAALSGLIPPVEGAVIETLFTLYDEQFAAVADAPAAVVAGTAGLPAERVREILADGLPAAPA
ncbi:MAG: squalene/phytoene synthase family protein [Alphaproteobacteria bacterium]